MIAPHQRENIVREPLNAFDVGAVIHGAGENDRRRFARERVGENPRGIEIIEVDAILKKADAADGLRRREHEHIGFGLRNKETAFEEHRGASLQSQERTALPRIEAIYRPGGLLALSAPFPRIDGAHVPEDSM